MNDIKLFDKVMLLEDYSNLGKAGDIGIITRQRKVDDNTFYILDEFANLLASFKDSFPIVKCGNCESCEFFGDKYEYCNHDECIAVVESPSIQSCLHWSLSNDWANKQIERHHNGH